MEPAQQALQNPPAAPFIDGSPETVPNTLDDTSDKPHDTRMATKSHSIDKGYVLRRRSLADDARFETQKKRELSMVVNDSIEISPSSESVNGAFAGNLTEPEARPSTHVVITLKKGVKDLGKVLELVEGHHGHVVYLETRRSQTACAQYEAFVTLEIKRADLLEFTKSLTMEGLGDLRIVKGISAAGAGDIWFPSHITDLDFCTHVLTKFEPDLDSEHPGFNDIAYRARRTKIAEVALDYKEGQPIPEADYTPEEVETWGFVYNEVKRLAPTHACAEFNRGLRILEQELGYGPHAIPQLQVVSDFLKRKSGFRLRPASGLLTARDFLASLAFRVFQCTQYVRHPSSPDHSPEPDCIHELIGHVPMFANPQFAEFSQDIGLASLGVGDEDIEKLATLYWFTVEYGLCKEGNNIRAYGAALLSSIGEIQHALSSEAAVLPFDPETTAVQNHQEQDYQPNYFLAESFLDAQVKLREYIKKNIRRPFGVAYDPYISSVVILATPQEVYKVIDKLQSQLSPLYSSLQALLSK